VLPPRRDRRVMRDRNLQNKARLAHVRYLDIEEM
jgi:hypothetical protein